MIKKNALLLAIMLTAGHCLKAQTTTSAEKPSSVKLILGTQGIGAEYAYGAFPKVAFRGGFTILPIDAHNVFSFSDFKSNTDVSARFTKIHLLADYTPFESARGFRLVGGFAYFAKASGTIDIVPTDNYKYGEIVLTPEQVGSVKMNIDWKGLAPYLGIGLFKMFPENKFNVNLDLGAYYLKKPDASIVGTGLLEGNASQTPQLNENIKDYRFAPTLQLNFSYKL